MKKFIAGIIVFSCIFISFCIRPTILAACTTDDSCQGANGGRAGCTQFCSNRGEGVNNWSYQCIAGSCATNCTCGSGGVGGECIGCTSPNTPPTFNGMYYILSQSVVRNSPTSATVSWVPNITGGNAPCGGSGSVMMAVMTAPGGPFKTVQTTCVGYGNYQGQTKVSTERLMCGYPIPADVPTCKPGGAPCPDYVKWVSSNSFRCKTTYTMDPACSYLFPVTWSQTAPHGKSVEVNTATVTGLTPNKIYYFTVLPWYHHAGNEGGTWCQNASPAIVVPSCSLLPPNQSLKQGDSFTLTNTIAYDPNITSVTFSGSGTYFSFKPGSTSTSPYQTVVTGIKTTYGVPQTITSNVYIAGASGSQCTATGTAAVLAPPTAEPWWQVQDSDVSSNGDLTSTLPSGKYFDMVGGGGYPGVPVFAGSTSLTTSDVSANHWLVNSANSGTAVYNYAYFANQIPAGTTINSLATNTIAQSDIDSGTIDAGTGYYWFEYDGSATGTDLNLSSNLNIGSKKVILLVNSVNFNIGGDINLTKGSGFFMVIVGQNTNLDNNTGNINIDPSVGGVPPQTVHELEGLYIADNLFQDGTNEPESADTQLWVRGSVVAYGGVNLNRDLGGAANDNYPAELFQYAPDQIILFPKVLATRKINWKEVAP